MGYGVNVWWKVVEFACRILGVCTATVLCAVGVETVQIGEYTSLGIYLIAASIGIMMFEMSYYIDALLTMCLPLPPDWQVFILWKKMAHIGGFHKFLYYAIMSLVCFLHPVLVWHAIIPGLMLLVTAIFNFLLSKNETNKASKTSHVSYIDEGPAAVGEPETATSEMTLTFLQAATGKEEALSSKAESDNRGESFQHILEKAWTPSDNADKKRRTGKDRGLTWFRGQERSVERELEEMGGYREPELETTSDTAPMITD